MDGGRNMFPTPNVLVLDFGSDQSVHCTALSMIYAVFCIFKYAKRF